MMKIQLLRSKKSRVDFTEIQSIPKTKWGFLDDCNYNVSINDGEYTILVEYTANYYSINMSICDDKKDTILGDDLSAKIIIDTDNNGTFACNLRGIHRRSVDTAHKGLATCMFLSLVHFLQVYENETGLICTKIFGSIGFSGGDIPKLSIPFYQSLDGIKWPDSTKKLSLILTPNEDIATKEEVKYSNFTYCIIDG